MADIALLTFHWEGASPVHSGYSATFAEFAKDARGAKRSYHLETRRQATTPPEPSLLVSSVKGVFRAASAWLVERAVRDLERQDFITCDYLAASGQELAAENLRRQIPCPVCRVYGGSGCRVGERFRARACVTFTFGKSDGLWGTVTKKLYTFAHEQARNLKTLPLIVEALQLPGEPPTLGLTIIPADPFPIALTCLAADLISSGFFRFGRFTSRGYGVVRLRPARYSLGSLGGLLRGEGEQVTTATSGFELAQALLGQNPLRVVWEEVRRYVQAEGADLASR